jgi:CheY-like chemotaxis protein
MSTYSPTVLVVEDDPACVRYLRRQFHDRTSVGVLVAKDIRSGRRLGEDVGIDALVTDLFFDTGKDLPEEELFDGVDLAAALKVKKPDLPMYVLSFMADDNVYHDKAKAKGVSVKRWLPKSFLGQGLADKPDSPWRIIEMDLMRARLGIDPVAKTQLDENKDADMLVSLAARLRRPMRTYIQELPDPGLRVTKPIEVICTLDEDLAKATAPALGLLNEGFGESIEEALEELATEIQHHYQELTQKGITTVDYAAELRKRLEAFVAEGP